MPDWVFFLIALILGFLGLIEVARFYFWATRDPQSKPKFTLQNGWGPDSMVYICVSSGKGASTVVMWKDNARGNALAETYVRNFSHILDIPWEDLREHHDTRGA